MGPYGSVGAHIKTGKRSMAPDHFQTPPDPKKGYKNQKNLKKYPVLQGGILLPNRLMGICTLARKRL